MTEPQAKGCQRKLQRIRSLLRRYDAWELSIEEILPELRETVGLDSHPTRKHP